MNGLGLGASYCGCWHVVYADGQRSQGMTFSVAKGYFRLFASDRIETKIFGYTIHYRGGFRFSIA